MRAVVDTNVLILSHPISRDPGDDKFIACVMGAKAGYLVTGDLDLKTLPPQPGFKIVSPRGCFE